MQIRLVFWHGLHSPAKWPPGHVRLNSAPSPPHTPGHFQGEEAFLQVREGGVSRDGGKEMREERLWERSRLAFSLPLQSHPK